MTRRLVQGFVVLMLCLTVSRPGLAEPFGIGDWRSGTFSDHPLVGKIWSATENRFVDQQELLEILLSAPVVLLGEKHDNADHHRLQARIVQTLVEKGKRPSLVFEMLTDAQTDAEQAIHDADIFWDELDKRLTWSDRGWPEWESYRQILGVARRSMLPVRAGNIPRSESRSVGHAGLDSLPRSDKNRLALDRALPKPARMALNRELLDSHCGYLPESALPAMSAVQMYRDARMAEAVLQATEAGRPAVLIAGAGHVRRDRAVPYFLNRRVPGLKTVVIAIREVDESEKEPAAYAWYEDSDEPPLFDYVIFTPRLDDIDPCEKFKAQFKNSDG